jgi:hypothetical protein
MSQAHDLNLMLASKVPIIVVETTDERRFIELLARIAIGTGSKQYRPVFQWSITDGIQRLDI